jgi:hypothetical protein
MGPHTRDAPPRRWPLALLATVAGALGVATIWVTLALATDRACGWMALVGAVDFALLLRLVRMPAGPRRIALAAIATILTAVASAWLVAAGQIGSMLGLYPLESAWRMGPVLGWELVSRGFGLWDWACIAASPLLAALCAWSRPRG